MKVNRLTALALAPLATLALPIVMVENLPATTTQHIKHQPPPAPVAKTRPAHALPEVILDVEDAAVQVTFDNKPVTPASTSTPEQVLAQPRPVATAYLLALGAAREKSAQVPQDAWEVVGASSIAQVEIGIVEGQRQSGHPVKAGCYYAARLTKDHNNKLVVFLVIAFLITVALVETSGAIYNSVQRRLSGQGPIRLEEAGGLHDMPLSVQSEVAEVTETKPADGHRKQAADEKISAL